MSIETLEWLPAQGQKDILWYIYLTSSRKFMLAFVEGRGRAQGTNFRAWGLQMRQSDSLSQKADTSRELLKARAEERH